MKRRRFYQLSLGIPYLALILSGAATYLLNGFNTFSDSSLPPQGILAGVLAFFTVSGVIWAPLYTWMVVVMLIWGRGKSTEDVRRLYLLSPVLLACSMGIPVLITDPASSGRFLLEGVLRINNMGFVVPALIHQGYEESSSVIGFAWLFMAAICIVVGYVFVGIAMWIERVLSKQGKFKEETEILPTNPS